MAAYAFVGPRRTNNSILPAYPQSAGSHDSAGQHYLLSMEWKVPAIGMGMYAGRQAQSPGLCHFRFV
jgi:hypothetical protein